MSLFPAYAEQAKNAAKSQESKEPWLENSSFQVEVCSLNRAKTAIEDSGIVSIGSTKSSDSDDNEESRRKRRKKQKKKKSKKHKTDKHEKVVDKNHVIDTKQVKEYALVDTIHRPAAPKYHVKYYLTNFKKYKQKKFKRYFKVIADKLVNNSGSEAESVITKDNLNKVGFQERDEHFTGFKQEEELSKITAEFNRKLADDPNDVKTWLEYIRFQDVVYQFEKSYRKGSIAKAQRVLAERKICIIEKALTHNPNCDDLLRERLNVAVTAFPSDELQQQLKKLVENDKGNIIWWQGYIEATQCSMSHCNTPAVLDLYTKSLSTLHKLRRNATVEKHLLEESILRMLYQCGLFLKQAGLFEQLWTLLRMYLELNLSPMDKTKFNIGSGFDEKQLVELEEVVFNSQLPLHELWLRTEKLRESCHWMPFLDEGGCEDPQRIVFSDDVAELIHPITMPENTFKMVATILTLLKVPLLPCRHTTMQDLGLDYVPWGLDSVEALLPAFFPMYTMDTSNENLLIDSSRLAVGPQYLKVLPAQDEYLNFVLKIIQNCADCLKNDDQTAVLIWWFRFQRLLIILEKQGRFKMPQYFKKKIKNDIKGVLKKEEYRNNEIYYLEYALIEHEFGNTDNCINILRTAISMNNNSAITAKDWDKPQSNQCFLYRTLVETLLRKGEVQQALKELVKLALQRDFTCLTTGLLLEAKTRFKLITTELLQNKLEKIPSANFHFLPDFFTDWIICNGWFLLLYENHNSCLLFMKETIEAIEKENQGVFFQLEVIYEFCVFICFKYCTENPGTGRYKQLDDILLRAIEKYPNNLFLLALLAKVQSFTFSMGPDWWKVQNVLLKSGRANSVVFAVVVTNQLNVQLEKYFKDTITGSQYQISPGLKNKMLSLFKKVTKSEMSTRRCGLIWRLYLQFVYTYFDSKTCRNVYYSAVEECPWLKALYIDAAIYIPTELPQIQDLIIEKQLRLHVTPEELDILRN